MAAIDLVGTPVVFNTGTGTSVTVNIPTGWDSATERLIAVINLRGGGRNVSGLSSSNATLVKLGAEASANAQALFEIVPSSGGNTTFNLQHGTTGAWTVIVSRVSNWMGGTHIDGGTTNVNDSTAGYSGLGINSGTYNRTSTGDELAVRAMSVGNTAGTWTMTSGGGSIVGSTTSDPASFLGKVAIAVGATSVADYAGSRGLNGTTRFETGGTVALIPSGTAPQSGAFTSADAVLAAQNVTITSEQDAELSSAALTLTAQNLTGSSSVSAELASADLEFEAQPVDYSGSLSVALSSASLLLQGAGVEIEPEPASFALGSAALVAEATRINYLEAGTSDFVYIDGIWVPVLSSQIRVGGVWI